MISNYEARLTPSFISRRLLIRNRCSVWFGPQSGDFSPLALMTSRKKHNPPGHQADLSAEDSAEAASLATKLRKRIDGMMTISCKIIIHTFCTLR